jgi:hypothetical protein
MVNRMAIGAQDIKSMFLSELIKHETKTTYTVYPSTFFHLLCSVTISTMVFWQEHHCEIGCCFIFEYAWLGDVSNCRMFR